MATPIGRGKSASENHCWSCGKPPETSQLHQKCGQCLKALYCSRTCQKNDWRIRHKTECIKFSQPGTESKIDQAAVQGLQGTKSFEERQVIALCKEIRDQYRNYPSPEPWTLRLIDIVTGGFEFDSALRQQQFSKIFQALNISFKDAIALSLGIGGGACVRALSQISGIKTVIGFEREEGFKTFLDKTFLENKNISIRIEDFNRVEFPENVHVVVAYESLLETSPEELSRLLKKIHKSLAEGGHFLVSLTLVSERILRDGKIIETHSNRCIFPSPDTVHTFFDLHGFQMKGVFGGDGGLVGEKGGFLLEKK